MKTNTPSTVISRSIGSQSLNTTIKFNLIFLVLILAFIFIPAKSRCQTDTLICDNGGFEDDFDYYFGKVASYRHGSDACDPLDENFDPVTWSSSSLPAFRRFAIVSSGVDTLTGINRTKFGSKALLLNNRYGHIPNICNSYYDVNKIVKRFKVTEENREFTVWFATVLELPDNEHDNTQPYFSITCNRAPNSDLCFQPSVLTCRQEYPDTICKSPYLFDIIAVSGWVCHRIKIPKNMVDSIAILEITAADCGESEHFGYAYIDGICEECTGSALGSATIYNHPIDEDGLGFSYSRCTDTITFCGTFTIPNICGDWDLDSILAFGYHVNNLEIDTPNLKFCIDIPKYLLLDNCKDFYLQFFFSSSNAVLPPVFSNSIYFCPEDIESHEVDVITGVCQDNNTSDMLSDDYYYVQVDLTQMHGDTFTIERWLDDPYPNESGHYVIKADTGDGTFNLGPFYIQEGSWILTIKIDSCPIDTFYITPPYFCSTDCNKFLRTRIFDVACADATPGTSTPADDTWSFKINVQGMAGQTYTINGVALPYYYNTTYPISVGIIGHACAPYRLRDVITNCFSDIIVCPPKPCSNDEECGLEVYLKDISCNENGTEFYVELNVSGAGSYLCYNATYIGGSSAGGGALSGSLGPFTISGSGIWLEVKICTTAICTCATPYCFKVIYVPTPDCDNLDFRTKKTDNSRIKNIDELLVVPNPVNSKEMILKSSMKFTSFEFYNSSAKLIYHGSFTGQEYKFAPDISPGIYFVRYKTSEGKYKYIKVIKL